MFVGAVLAELALMRIQDDGTLPYGIRLATRYLVLVFCWPVFYVLLSVGHFKDG